MGVYEHIQNSPLFKELGKDWSWGSVVGKPELVAITHKSGLQVCVTLEYTREYLGPDYDAAPPAKAMGEALRLGLAEGLSGEVSMQVSLVVEDRGECVYEASIVGWYGPCVAWEALP